MESIYLCANGTNRDNSRMGGFLDVRLRDDEDRACAGLAGGLRKKPSRSIPAAFPLASNARLIFVN
jgi:hypothetical protein